MVEEAEGLHIVHKQQNWLARVFEGSTFLRYTHARWRILRKAVGEKKRRREEEKKRSREEEKKRRKEEINTIIISEIREKKKRNNDEYYCFSTLTKHTS